MRRIINWGKCPQARREQIRKFIAMNDKRAGEKLTVQINFHGAGIYGCDLFNSKGKLVAIF